VNKQRSGVGTYRACCATLTMSVDKGKADLAVGRIEVRKWTHSRRGWP